MRMHTHIQTHTHSKNGKQTMSTTNFTSMLQFPIFQPRVNYIQTELLKAKSVLTLF